jgi:hypothetical protein
MRMLLEVHFPHKPFNAAVADGTIGKKIARILDDLKPDATYFTEIDGKRSAVLIIDIDDAQQIPTYAEPWFLLFEADVKLRPVMTPEDLAKSGLDGMAKKWLGQ